MFLTRRPMVLDNFLDDDTGMVTPEYAVGMIAAVGFAVALLLIAKSDGFRQALTDLIGRALTIPS
jgi:hypothetical protein